MAGEGSASMMVIEDHHSRGQHRLARHLSCYPLSERSLTSGAFRRKRGTYVLKRNGVPSPARGEAFRRTPSFFQKAARGEASRRTFRNKLNLWRFLRKARPPPEVKLLPFLREDAEGRAFFKTSSLPSERKHAVSELTSGLRRRERH